MRVELESSWHVTRDLCEAAVGRSVKFRRVQDNGDLSSTRFTSWVDVRCGSQLVDVR